MRTIAMSQYPLRRASSWRALDRTTPPPPAESQYPLRRASSWRMDPGQVEGNGKVVSIPSQAGILLAAPQHPRHPLQGHVSIPSQAGILLAVRTCA